LFERIFMSTIRDTIMQFLQQIRSLGETAPQPRGAEGSAPRLALSPGAEVLATVMGKLDNGMSLVRVSSQLFAMELPPRFQTGDSLRMTFLNQDARPTFALANQTLSGTPLTMSSAGQLLRRLMRDPVPDAVYAKSPLPTREPLLDGPPNDTARLAGRLRQALGESGVFYESHLKEWAMGERPIAQLLREPQAALSRPEIRTRVPEIPLPDRPVVGDLPAEPAVSGLPAENEVSDAIAPFPREKQPLQSPGREPAPAGTRAHGGEVRPDGRPESGKSLQHPESTASSTEGGAKDTTIPTSPDRRPAESAAQELVRPGSDRVNQDGIPSPEKQPAESGAKQPGRPMNHVEKHEEMPLIREEGGKPLREAASQQRDVSGILPDDLPRTPASEHPAASPHIREQGSLRQEPAEKPPAAPESPLPQGAEQPGTQTDNAQKTPAAAEQRARLLKETYGRLDPALLKRDAQDVPAEMPRAETEQNAGISRPDPAGVRAEANQEAPRTSPVVTPSLSPVDERDGKEAASVTPSLQGEIADARTLPLVRQQLNLLTSGMFLWQGEAWKGQPMEWEVREREAQPEQGEEHGWQTTLRLELPNLGRVSGMINLAGKELRLTLEAGSADSASLLGRRTADLKDRLEAAGIEMKGVVVRHEELEGA
jgi:hypothetical protein